MSSQSKIYLIYCRDPIAMWLKSWSPLHRPTSNNSKISIGVAVIILPHRSWAYRFVMNASRRIQRYLHVHKCPKSRKHVAMLGSDRDRIGHFMLTFWHMLSYLNRQMNRLHKMYRLVLLRIKSINYRSSRISCDFSFVVF